MEILRIEPTPSPNTMKVVLSYTREDKLSNTYKKVEETQPRFINQLLSVIYRWYHFHFSCHELLSC